MRCVNVTKSVLLILDQVNSSSDNHALVSGCVKAADVNGCTRTDIIALDYRLFVFLLLDWAQRWRLSGFLATTSVIAFLSQAYLPAKYKWAKSNRPPSVVWNGYGYTWDFISSTLPADRMAMRSQPLSWAREWLCTWRKIIPVSSSLCAYKAAASTPVSFHSMWMMSITAALYFTPRSSAGFQEASPMIHFWIAGSIDTEGEGISKTAIWEKRKANECIREKRVRRKWSERKKPLG